MEQSIILIEYRGKKNVRDIKVKELVAAEALQPYAGAFHKSLRKITGLGYGIFLCVRYNYE